MRRMFSWWFGNVRLATRRKKEKLPVVITRHESLLLRRLGNADMRLQYNKVKNLRIASNRMTHIVMAPGETFSLWRSVGRASRLRGYVPGMLLSQGEVIEGVGGGLCQLANLLHWMALHSPLVVSERYHHSFDAFPDSGRVLPFGSGATIFYNYIDLKFYNPTNQPIQICVWLDDTHLQGELRTTEPLPYSYKVIERDHKFTYVAHEKKYYRENALYQARIDRKTGKYVDERLLYKNHSEVKYIPNPDIPVIRLP
jgi:vancomycin resistance protein VanW